MRSKLLSVAGIFFLLFILFFPLDFLGDFQRKVSLFLFGDLTEWMAKSLFATADARIDFSSDSTSMFIFVGMLLLLSLLAAIFMGQRYSRKILYLSKEIVVLYLVIVLMKYGFDKVFKAQFYLPEPNILYSRFGNLDKDILFWSTMGTSRLYSVSMGIVELTAAFLILFSRTRALGLLLSVGILANIFLINIGFDISVKFFSLILFLMTIFALKDDWIPMYRFFILKQELKKKEIESYPKLQPFLVFFRTVFIGISVMLILLPYSNSGNYNDDTAGRPLLHGAFKNVDQHADIQYIFFHRNNYLILMDKNEKMTDFHFSLTSKNRLILENYNGQKTNLDFVYQKEDSLLTVSVGRYKIKTKEQNWRKMNALRPLFHTRIESLK